MTEIEKAKENLLAHLARINSEYSDKGKFSCHGQLDDIKDIAVALEKFEKFALMQK